MGANRKLPAVRSRMAPKTLGESGRGRHNHSMEPSGATRQLFSQSEMNPYSAIGGKLPARPSSASSVTFRMLGRNHVGVPGQLSWRRGFGCQPSGKGSASQMSGVAVTGRETNTESATNRVTDTERTVQETTKVIFS